MTTETETSSWAGRLVAAAKNQLTSMFPALGAVDAAKDFISEAVAQRIRDEAFAKAQALMAKAHHDVIRNIAWQNGLLLLSILPVYLLHSAVPFYFAYACVAGYTAFSVYQSRGLVVRLVRTRSVTKTLALEVREAIEQELTLRQFYERKVVEWLGPDLTKLSHEVARKLRGDVLAAVVNMAFTLFMAFVAFRLFAIPLLEHKALLH
jgi:hypothetical protein